MTTVNDILAYFETFAPVATAMDFDNCGLLVGDGHAAVRKALLALDITPAVVREAADTGCELIISHHPVIFQPIKRLNTESVPYLLAQHQMAAVCMHTNLDLSESFGVNLCLAASIGVQNVRRAEQGECLFIGTLAQETDIRTFAAAVKNALGCDGLRYTAAQPTIRTVAVASGAGGSDIFAAAAQGADVLVTGEIKHHEIIAANSLGVSVIDAGHFRTENVVLPPLKEKLQAQFPQTDFLLSAVCTDGMRYI